MIYLLLSFIAIVIIFLIIAYVSNFFLNVTEYSVSSDKLKDFIGDRKIIVISDLHNVSFGKNNEKIIQQINKINPIYIFVAGDMLNNKSQNNNINAQNLIKTLSEKYKIIYADGNHEQGFFSKDNLSFNSEEFDKFYSLDGICPNPSIVHLENNFIEYGDVRIYGLRIDRYFYRRFKRPEFTLEYLTNSLGKSSKNCYNIVIAHNPLYFEDYVNWGADLVISGHLHGGMLRLPFIGGVISPQFVLFPKYSGGKYIYNKGTLILSKGMGMHTIKLRLFNLPELIVLSAEK